MCESARKIIDDLLGYAVKFAEQHEDTAEEACWEAIEAARTYLAQPESSMQDNLAVLLLTETDSYLREIRAENLDGSEPSLGTLLDKVTGYWISQGKSQPPHEILKSLIASGLEFSDCVTVFGEGASDPYVAAAHEKAREGEIEVDDMTVVSRGSTEGAYVMAWMWVSNEAAGILCNVELLEVVLEHARVGLDGSRDLDAELVTLRHLQADWLENLINNFADLINDIEEEELKGIPGSITWDNGAGKPVSFMPSDALNQLRQLARLGGLPDGIADQAERFCIQFGNKLDALLAANQPD